MLLLVPILLGIATGYAAESNGTAGEINFQIAEKTKITNIIPKSGPLTGVRNRLTLMHIYIYVCVRYPTLFVWLIYKGTNVTIIGYGFESTERLYVHVDIIDGVYITVDPVVTRSPTELMFTMPSNLNDEVKATSPLLALISVHRTSTVVVQGKDPQYYKLYSEPEVLKTLPPMIGLSGNHSIIH